MSDSRFFTFEFLIPGVLYKFMQIELMFLKLLMFNGFEFPFSVRLLKHR